MNSKQIKQYKQAHRRVKVRAVFQPLHPAISQWTVPITVSFGTVLRFLAWISGDAPSKQRVPHTIVLLATHDLRSLLKSPREKTIWLNKVLFVRNELAPNFAQARLAPFHTSPEWAGEKKTNHLLSYRTLVLHPMRQEDWRDEKRPRLLIVTCETPAFKIARLTAGLARPTPIYIEAKMNMEDVLTASVSCESNRTPDSWRLAGGAVRFSLLLECNVCCTVYWKYKHILHGFLRRSHVSKQFTD